MAGINTPQGNVEQLRLPEWVIDAQNRLAALRRDVNASVEQRSRVEQLDLAFGDTVGKINAAVQQGDTAAADALLRSAAELVVDIEEIQVLNPTRSRLAALRGSLPPMPANMAA